MLEKFTDDREKIERYSAIANLCPLPIFIVAHDGKSIVYINPAYREFTGRSIDELQDFKWLEMVHPDDRTNVAAVWKQFVLDENPVPSLRRYVHKNGKVSEAVMTAYRVEQNGFVGFIVPRCTEGCFFMKLVPPAGIPPAT